MIGPLRAFDRWLVAPASGHLLACVRTALAVTVGVRLLLRDWTELAGRPDGLFAPPGVLEVLPSMPPSGVLLALQVVGVLAAALAVAQRRPTLSFAVAWLCLLVLAGLRSSAGKILHNDVLLLLGAAPFLVAAGDARRGDATRSARWGWPIRAALLTVGAVYCVTGVEKLVHSGLDWVTGDNMRWIMYQAAGGAAPTDTFSLFIADRAWLAHVVAGALLVAELTAPVLLLMRRTRPWCVLGAIAIHGGTWLLLGLDYWVWILTIAAVCLPWERWWPARRLAA